MQSGASIESKQGGLNICKLSNEPEMSTSAEAAPVEEKVATERNEIVNELPEADHSKLQSESCEELDVVQHCNLNNELESCDQDKTAAVKNDVAVEKKAEEVETVQESIEADDSNGNSFSNLSNDQTETQDAVRHSLHNTPTSCVHNQAAHIKNVPIEKEAEANATPQHSITETDDSKLLNNPPENQAIEVLNNILESCVNDETVHVNDVAIEENTIVHKSVIETDDSKLSNQATENTIKPCSLNTNPEISTNEISPVKNIVPVEEKAEEEQSVDTDESKLLNEPTKAQGELQQCSSAVDNVLAEEKITGSECGQKSIETHDTLSNEQNEIHDKGQQLSMDYTNSCNSATSDGTRKIVEIEKTVLVETEKPMQAPEDIVIIEIEDDDALNNPSLSQAEYGCIQNTVAEEATAETVTELNVNVQRAAQIAIRDLCKKVTGKDVTIELAQTETENHGDTEANSIINSSVQTEEEYTNNVEMQKIVKTVISGYFQKPFRNRKTYFNNNTTSLPLNINGGSISALNDNLTGKFLMQPIIDMVITAIPKKTIEDILKQVKILTATEYLMLHLKLAQMKYNKTNESPESLNAENDTELKWDEGKYSQMQQILEPSLSFSSKEIIETIIHKAESLTPAQYLFFYYNLPKFHDDINNRCRQAPARCSPVVNQTVMWLMTHFEESPGFVLPKRIVFELYYDFCARSELKALSTSDIGKMIKQMFPTVKPKRQVSCGKPQYCYCGIQRRFTLCSPSLPKLSNKPQVKEYVLFSCHECCTVFKNMHNPRKRLKQLQEQINKEQTVVAISTTTTVTQAVEHEGFYKDSTRDGEAVVVHDPLELLSLSMNDDSNDHSKNVPAEEMYASSLEKMARAPNFKCYPGSSRSYQDKLILTMKSRFKNRVYKGKYKQYIHPSVQKTLRSFKNIILPNEVYKLNINPVVALNNDKLKNWCAQSLDKQMRKLSTLVITKIRNCPNYKVTCKCCNGEYEVSSHQGQQLSDLKRMLSSIAVQKLDSENYFATYSLPKEVLRYSDASLFCNRTFQITKTLFNAPFQYNYKSKNFVSSSTLPAFDKIAHKLRNHHPSVRKLLQQFKRITLPEEVFRSDVDPAIVLDSGEVCDWYEQQLNNLKRKLVRAATGNSENDRAARQSTAKMMNFCESDSDCSDTGNRALNPNAFVQDVAPETLENNELVSEESFPNQDQDEGMQELDRSTKRSRIDEATNDIMQKRRKFYCSKIVINSSNKPEVETVNQMVYETAPNQNLQESSSEFVCTFCLKEFTNKRQLTDHTKIHLYCRSCKRRFKCSESMRQHLVHHCMLNDRYCKPFLHLHRIDHLLSEADGFRSVPEIINLDVRPNSVNLVDETVNPRGVFLNRDNHRSYINNLNILASNTLQGALSMTPNIVLNENKESYTLTANPLHSSGQQQHRSYLRVADLPRKEVARYEIANVNSVNNIHQQSPQLTSTFQLKNTISNNFNRIFVVPSNPPQPESQSPNSMYGVYSYNTNQPTNTSNTYSAPDCAMSMNPLSSAAEPATNFMQIVESPSTTIAEYASPVVSNDNGRIRGFAHHDHSYYQQEPTFQTNSDVNSSDEVVLINNVSDSELSDFDMPHFNNINTEIPTQLEPLRSDINTSESTNPPTPGQFRIRVRDIRELS